MLETDKTSSHSYKILCERGISMGSNFLNLGGGENPSYNSISAPMWS